MKPTIENGIRYALPVLLLVWVLPALGQVSDDFSGSALDTGLWTFVDPVGDSSLEQADGRVIISVPEGNDHDLWTDGNNAARILQPIADTDFEIEAKFESTPFKPFQIQGMLVEQDSQNYLRLDYYYSDIAGLRLFAAGFINDMPIDFGATGLPFSSTLYVRLTRTGNQWEVRYSNDGAAWYSVFLFDHTLVASNVGVYAGNVGAPAPAFDAIVDYFFDTATPIDPEDGGLADLTPPVIGGVVATVGAYDAQIVFTTDEPALGRVVYGLTPALELGTTGNPDHRINHAVELPGLLAGTTYYIQVEALDTSGNLGQDVVQQIVTLAVPNILPSVIVTNPNDDASFSDGDSIFVVAAATDSDGTVAMVEFLADGAVMDTVYAAPWEFTWTSAPVGNHDLTARATDNDGGVTVSAPVAITVNPPAGTPVAVSDDFSALAFNDSLWTFVDPVGDSGLNQVNGRLTLSLPGNSDHDLWTGGNNSARIMQPVVDVDIALEAKFESAPLLAYQIQGILVEQDSSNYIRLDYYHDGANLRVFGASFADDVPTTRVNLAVPAGSLLWLRLARVGDQWLGEYSFDGVSWGQAFDFNHALTLANVGVFAGNSGTPAPAFDAVVDYFFDANAPIDPEDGGVVDLLPPVISGVNVVPGVTDATVTFATDEPALGRVHYGLTPALELGVVTDPGYLLTHAIVLPALTAETLYYYQIDAEDGSTNLAALPVDQFTTLDVPNDPPVITLDAPLSGTYYADGDTVFMMASAGDTDGTVDLVEFLSDGVVVGFLTAAPWDFAWSTATVGNHTLTARATDNDGGVTLSNPANITVRPPLGAPVAVSDDFSALAFDDTLWTLVDPVGDGSAYQANGLLTLSVPADSEHDLWTGGNETVRIMQPVADADFELEVKFESTPQSAYQIQGLLLEEAAGSYIRLDYYHDGAALHLFGASMVADSPTVRGNVVVPLSTPLWLRVWRLADTFTVYWSDDGVVWQTAFSFSHALVVNNVGVFAGNAGSPVPAFDVVVDYFFDTNNVISPEDDGVVDVWPPLVGNIEILPDPVTGTAQVTCVTSEPATTLFSYGLDALYGTDVPGTSGDGFNHAFTLTGLVPDEVYHFSILAADTLSNAAATPDDQFLNVEIKPVITVWGGLNQRVGHLGVAQADFNLAGNVFLWENLSTLGYSVNGAPEVPLNWGNREDGFGDGRRLARNGDFNVDFPFDQLLPGANTIAVRAVDIYGKEDLVTATVTRETGSSTQPLFIDWDAVADPQDVGQTVDGRWSHGSAGLRTISTGYDRIFLLGEETWQDYEIVCPITIHEVQTPGPFSDKPGMGFLMRFTGHIVGGHRDWPDAQPKWGYQPFGGIGWLRWYSGPSGPPTVQFYHGDYDVSENFGSAKNAESSTETLADPELIPFGDEGMTTDFALANIAIGETFWMKMRCETLADAPNGDGVTQYSYKVWLDTELEPTEWDFQVVQQSEFALRQGSVALLAHHVDVTFGDASVIGLTGSVADVGDPVPQRFALADNYPNPFNPLTQIAFELPSEGRVQLAVFDIRGRQVRTLVSQSLPAGPHSIYWNGTDDSGQPVASGPYLYRLDAGGLTAVKKMLLLK